MASTRSRSPGTNRIRGAAPRVSIWALILTLVSCFDFHPPTSAPPPGAPTETTAANATAATVVLVGAGDIAVCGSSRDEATAILLDSIPGTVFTAGDNAYPDGTVTDFNSCYESSWGRHKARTRPSPGNHDYHFDEAAAYYAYFGANAGPTGRGYYSYDIGDWHVVSLNSIIDRTTNSPQVTWLRADLAASTKQCTVAYWHHARFSSGTQHGSNTSMQPMWQALYDAGAEIVIAGHEHNYERFAPQTPTGQADPATGIREFVVGTGGASFYDIFAPLPNSEVRNGATSGVLKLTLNAGTYSWQFIPVAGQTFTDEGSGVCHGPPSGGGVSASQSTVTASPTSIITGGSSSTITVTARDGLGNPISGASVIVAASGSGNTLTQPTGTTNASGVATGSLASSVAELKTVSATISGTAITQTATVTVFPPGSVGTITHALLASGSAAPNANTYTTAVIAPAPNALITVAVRNHRTPAANSPSLSGGGMTSWTPVASIDYDPVSGSLGRLTVFRAMSASPGSGPLTITFSGSVSNVDWIVSQWTGVDQSGTNGSGAIGQTGSARGDAVTALSVPLAAFANANNVAYGAVGARLNAPAITPGNGFTEIAEVTPGEKTLLETQFATNLNTIQASIASAKNAALLGIEIKAGAGGDPTVSASQSTVSAVSPITAGASSSITVTVKDGSGNPISGVGVTLSATGSNSITQPAALTDVNGVTTGSLSATVAGSNQVTAVAGGVTLNQQPTVVVNPGPATTLAYTTHPSNTAANAPIAPPIVVEIRDAFSNRVNSGASVTMAIGTDPGSGTLAGTNVQVASAGVATFSDLAINSIANGYTLVASSAGLTNATSNLFNITTPVPSAALSTVVAGTPSFTAGGNSDITVTVKDGLGNAISGVTVTLSSTVGGDVVTQPAATDGSGQTTGNVAATSAGPRTITAVAGGITLNQQPTVTVTAGAANASQSTVAALPTSISAGSGTSTITVTVRDQYGNPVGGSNVGLSATGTGNTLLGGGATNSSGVATGTLSSTDAESKIVSTMADGTPITQTATVTVTPAGSGATITHTLLASGSNAVNQKVYSTATIAPGPNTLVTVAVLSQRSYGAISATLSGGGMSAWEQVASVDFDTLGFPLRRMTIFRALSASPGSGPITITFSANVSNCQWIVSQWDGVETSGVNGAGAIVQAGLNRANSSNGLTVTLGAFGNANNVAYGAFGVNKNVPAIMPGAGFTKIDEQPSGENTPGDLLTEWAVNRSTINATWTNLRGGALGVEIKARTGP